MNCECKHAYRAAGSAVSHPKDPVPRQSPVFLAMHACMGPYFAAHIPWVTVRHCRRHGVRAAHECQRLAWRVPCGLGSHCAATPKGAHTAKCDSTTWMMAWRCGHHGGSTSIFTRAAERATTYLSDSSSSGKQLQPPIFWGHRMKSFHRIISFQFDAIKYSTETVIRPALHSTDKLFLRTATRLPSANWYW